MSWSLDCDCFLDDNEVSARSSRNSKDHLPLTDWVVGETWQTIQGWGCGSVGQTWSIGPSRRCRRFHSPVRQEIFLPESTFSEDFLTYVRTPPCAIACINICAHVKDSVVHVRIRWIMEAQKHQACTVGWIARLCRSWLSSGTATRISHGWNPRGNTAVKST